MSEAAAPVTPVAAPASDPGPDVEVEGSPGTVPGADKTPADPNKPAAPETPAEKKARKLKLKVFGKEEEVDVDAMPDEKLALELQMGRAARQHITEASKQRQQVEQVLKYLKDNPFAPEVKDALGYDILSKAEEEIARRYKEAQLPPEQQEALESRRQAEAEKARASKLEQEIASMKQAEIDRKVHAEIERDFKTAASKSGLPNTYEILYLMAEVAKTAADDGLELTPDQIAAQVRERVTGIHTHVTKSLRGEELVKYLGPEVVREVLKIAVARKKASGGAPNSAVPLQQDIDVDKPTRKAQDYRSVAKSFRN
jgi:hypothetical protein